MHEEVYIDTVWLSQDLKRVVMMNSLANCDAAMVLDNKPSLIPAITNTLGGLEYLRMDADCQTVVCGLMPHPRHHVTTPQFEVYSISEGQPCFRVEPLSASIEHELGSFVDVSVNDYALTLFGTEGAIQIRFVGQDTIPDETRTSSRYLPLDSQGWVALQKRDVQNSQEAIPISHPALSSPSQEDTEVYDSLEAVRQERQAKGEKPPRLITISDVAKDYDDLTAWVVLKGLEDRGLIKQIGYIANLDPPQERTQFGRGALDKLERKNTPIAVGSNGTDEAHEVYSYEFSMCDFMATKKITETGQELLPRLYRQAEQDYQQAKKIDEQAKRSDYAFKILLLSSLRDIDTFAQNEPTMFKDFTSEVVLQGGCFISPETGILEADSSAANNSFDQLAADRFHRFMQDNNIRSTAYTKVATFETPITSGFFEELAASGHPIGIHLNKVQPEQDYKFLERARNDDPSKRFRPFMDEKWVLESKSTWFETHSEKEPFLEGRKALPYLKKVTAYDALAAVGSGGDDVLAALKIPRGSYIPECIGVVAKDGTKDFNKAKEGKYMSRAIRALMRGALT
jgi:hypothetical protein